MGEIEVVITGAGLITPLGNDLGENWENMKAMKTGISRHRSGDLPGYLQYMGKVSSYEPGKDIPHKLLSQMKFLNRGSLLGFIAAREALSSSRPGIEGIPPERRALYIASGDMTKVGYDFMFPATKDGTGGKWKRMDFEKLNRATVDRVNPFFLLESISNNLFSFLSAFLEFTGPNTCLASHSPCGGNALELASRSIRQGDADIAMAVGCGCWITEVPLYEMGGLGILSKCRDGVHSYRPFDRKRDGFIPGEGGAAVLLESRETAEKRGAKPLATIGGFGNCIEFSSDRTIGVPPAVSARGIAMALEDAQCTAGDLAFISPHGSGSQKGDRSELRSIIEACDAKRLDVPICGLKPYTGHLGAASDIAEVIFGIRAVAEGVVPATLNFREGEKEFDCLRISGAHQACEKEYFLSVSYGIGGQSSSVVVRVQRNVN